MGISLLSWGQEQIEPSPTDSLAVYKVWLAQAISDFKNHEHKSDSLVFKNLALSKTTEELKIKNRALSADSIRLKNRLNATRNTLAQTETNLTKIKQHVSSLKQDSLNSIKQGLQLMFTIDNLKNANNETQEQLDIKKDNLEAALSNLEQEKDKNTNYQQILEDELGQKKSLEDSLGNITSQVVNLSQDNNLLLAKKDSLERSIKGNEAEISLLEVKAAEFKEQNTYFLAVIYIGMAFILVIFIYIVTRTSKTDEIETQYAKMASIIKEEHPMLKETLTHYLRYKLYSRILRHALILVTAGTIIFVSATVIIYFGTGEAQQLFTEDFWKMISGIGLPLVLTITIFNGVEQKKIDTAKILFEHKMITTTTI